MGVPGRIRRRRRAGAGFRSAAEDKLGAARLRGLLVGLVILVRAMTILTMFRDSGIAFVLMGEWVGWCAGRNTEHGFGWRNCGLVVLGDKHARRSLAGVVAGKLFEF